MNAADRTRLAKLLGMLGSAHAGERDAAALAVARFVKQHDTTWAKLLNPPAIEKKLPEMGTWRETARKCLARGGRLGQWEKNFLSDLPGFRRLSVKQRYILDEIAKRVLVEAPA